MEVAIVKELNQHRIQSAFGSQEISFRDFVSQQKMKKTLERLNNDDEEFDSEIFDQLWEQCKLNSQGKSKVSIFADKIIQAQEILLKKLQQTNVEIHKIEVGLRLQQILPNDRAELNLQLTKLIEQKEGFQFDLNIIKKPFLRFKFQPIPELQEDSNLGFTTHLQNQRDNKFDEFDSSKQNLGCIFYLSVVGIFGEGLVYLYLNTFMNSLLFLMIISTYLFQFFDRPTFRLLLWLTVFTIGVDLVWYVMNVKNIWEIHESGIWAQFLGGYLKLSVILISFVFILKVIIVMLLCSQYNIDEDKSQEIDLCAKRFVLKNDNLNPFFPGRYEPKKQASGKMNQEFTSKK